MSRRVVAIAASALLLSSLATPAGASGPAPTVITAASAAVSGTTATISGTVDFGGQAPVIIGTDPQGDAPGGRSDLDLTSIAAWVDDGDVPVLTFAWRMADLTDAPPPEVVRYYWQFGVGGSLMSLQAKTSDFVSAANAAGTPQGIAANVSSYAEHYQRTGKLPQFRIRGNCETIVALNSCGHVAWADGAFDVAANEIRFHAPLDSAAATALRPGATVTADTNGAYSAIQAAADTTNTRDTVAQTSPYTIPTRTASATVITADGPGATTPLTVGADGSISGSVNAAGATAVRITACFAANCDTSTVPLS